MGVRYLLPRKYAKQFTGNESLSLPITAGLVWVELTDVPGTPSVSVTSAPVDPHTGHRVRSPAGCTRFSPFTVLGLSVIDALDEVLGEGREQGAKCQPRINSTLGTFGSYRLRGMFKGELKLRFIYLFYQLLRCLY